MLLTAQLVVSPSGVSGINVYRYAHPGRAWAEPPADLAESDPGELVGRSLSVPPGGNRVRSYLDIMAPDEAMPDLATSFETFIEQSKGSPLPWRGRVGVCYFRVGLDAGLTPTWPIQLGELLDALRVHLVQGAGA